MVRVAIVEDNKQTARLLCETLRNEEIQVCGCYSSGEEALTELAKGPLPDVVFMDIGLPGISGIETTREIKRLYADQVDVIVQTVFEDERTILKAIEAGISGYLLKGIPPAQVRASIQEIQRGGSPLSGKVARIILQRHQAQPRQSQQSKESPSTGFSFQDASGRVALSPREEEILRLLAEGLTYKEIGLKTSLSTFTVNNHLRRIYEKMRVNSRHEATVKFLKSKD